MKDYIERAAVLKSLGYKENRRGDVLPSSTFDIILKEPAANVVEPVHCSQCAHHEENGYHWCNKWEHILPDDSDFFCKWGRKKEAADAN